jgi:hypothetical protein
MKVTVTFPKSPEQRFVDWNHVLRHPGVYAHKSEYQGYRFWSMYSVGVSAVIMIDSFGKLQPANVDAIGWTDNSHRFYLLNEDVDVTLTTQK